MKPIISRSDILNHLIRRNGYRDYLEIGVSSGQLFKKVEIQNKIGVDPAFRFWYLFDSRVRRTTSDQFFETNKQRFDLVFVDGLHEADQAYRDIVNTMKVLRPGGTLVMHDCLPISKEQQAVPRIQRSWTGDVWRSFLKASVDPKLTAILLDTDHGCGVIRLTPRPQGQKAPPQLPDPLGSELTWEAFDEHKAEWLEIVPVDAIYARLDALSAENPGTTERARQLS